MNGGEMVDLPNEVEFIHMQTTEKMIADSLSGNNSVNHHLIMKYTVVQQILTVQRHSLFSMLESAANYGGV